MKQNQKTHDIGEETPRDETRLYSSLKKKKEKKLKYDYKKIEKIIEEFLQKYEIDLKIEEFLYNEFSQKLNKNEIMTNIQVLLGKESKNKYKVQLSNNDFQKYNEKIYNIIKENINKEIEYLESIKSEELQMRKEIFDNLFEEIQLTMFDKGIQRLTLVSFHYYIKVLEYFAHQYMTEANITNIKRTKNVLEIFIKDLISVISDNDEMTRFLLTLKSLIEQWLTKYNAKTKIGEFYYDILMIVPEHITERILKYLLFTAIKNKNPLTLRAIFSSYLTLIHQNIFSFYAINLSKIRIGYFKQLDTLFTDNFNLIYDDTQNYQSSNYLIDMMTQLYLLKNKKYFKDDFYLLNDDFVYSFFEPNYFELVYGYDKNSVNFIDYIYFYNKTFKVVKTSYSEISKYHKLNHSFFKNNNRKKYINFVKDQLIRNLYKQFYNVIEDKDTIDEIFNVMAKNIVQKLNINHFLDENYKIANIDEKFYLKELDKFIMVLSNKIKF